VISLRFPGYAVQHPDHVLWLNHRMREYYDLWDQFSSHLTWKGRIKEGMRRALIHRVDQLLHERLQRRLRDLRARCKRGSIASATSSRTCCIRRRRSATIDATSYGDYLFGVSRLAPLKRFDLVMRALAEPVAAGIQCVIAGEGAELEHAASLRAPTGLEQRVAVRRTPDRCANDRSPRALPRGGLPAVQRRLRLRDRRGIHVRQAGDYVPRQRRTSGAGAE
jgi:glycosyltransferase involved in cell wall biosynthesis